MRRVVATAILMTIVAVTAASAETPRTLRSVSLYFGAKNGRGLVPEERLALVMENRDEFLSFLVHELIAGPGKKGVRLIPSAAVLRHIFMDEKGTLFVDFSGAVRVPSAGGIASEWLLVASVVRTVMENVDFVKKVVLLIDGRPVGTLSGHVDLTEGFTLDDVSSTTRMVGIR